jgi:hypothetical protein
MKLGGVVPGVLPAGDLLARLVSLADEEDDVARRRFPHRPLDRAAPVGLDAHASLRREDAAEHRLDDRTGIFRAGIVAGEDRKIGGGDRRAHRRALARVAIAAAAADDDQPAVRTQAARAREHAAEALRGMGVVDDPEHRLARDSLHPTASAAEDRNCAEHAVQVFAEQDRRGGSRGQIARVVLAEQACADAPASDAHYGAVLVALLERPRQQRLLPTAVEGDLGHRRRDHEMPISVVRVREREGGGGKIREEAPLDFRVGLDRAVVVEMVVVEAREDAPVELDSGDPLLVDPVRGDFHEAVAAAGAHHHRQEALQHDRIRSRVLGGMPLAAYTNAGGGDQPARVAECPEELVEQRRHGRLAVRAGDSDHRQRP